MIKNRKIIFSAACSILILIACKNEERIPENLYNHHQIAMYLLDVYLLETRIDELEIRKDSAIKIFNHYEQQLMQKHNFEDSIYFKSYQYYLEHPKQLLKVHDIILDSLTLYEQVHGYGVMPNSVLHSADSSQKSEE